MQFFTNLMAKAAAVFNTSVTESVAEEAPEMFFEPVKFVDNLKYMGIGMLVIFVVIGIIILTTMMINKAFSD